MTKTCQKCGKDFSMKPYDRPYRFQYRKYCSPECSRPPYSGPTTKTCEGCGEVYGMNEHDARSPARFRIRKYCSQACYRKAPKSWHKRKPIDMPDLWFPSEIREALNVYS